MVCDNENLNDNKKFNKFIDIMTKYIHQYLIAILI